MTDPDIEPSPPIVTLEPPKLEYYVAPAHPASGGGGDDDEEASEDGKPLIWQDLKYIDIDDTIAGEGVQLVGYRVYCRCYQMEITTDGDTGEVISKIKIQLPYTITESSLTISSPEPPLFINQVDPPEEPTTLFAPAIRSYGAGEWAVGGILDMSTYDYYRVFDEAVVSWLPRAASLEQQYIEPGEHGFHYPYEPEVDHDRPRPKYPMDTISAWVPDEREFIDVQYSLSVTGAPYGNGSAGILHTVFQDMDNMVQKLRRVLDRCYFTHGLYHNGLYFNEANRNYNVRGEIRGIPVEIFDADENLVRTESYNDRGELLSFVREPIYPLRGELIPIVANGELVAVSIRDAGGFYPKNFMLKFRDMDFLTVDAEAPIARAIVAPIEERNGRLVGGQITSVEIIKPGTGIRRIGRIGRGNRDLTNTRYDYNEGFSNTRPLEPTIPIEERTPND